MKAWKRNETFSAAPVGAGGWGGAASARASPVSILPGLVVLAALLMGPGVAWAGEDDRLARIEESVMALRQDVAGLNKDVAGLKEGQRQMEKRIDGLERSLNKRIDDVQETMRWGFGILFMMMIALVGFVIWDRRTTVAPVVRRVDRIEEAMREYAKKDPKFAELMKSLGLL